MRDKARHSNCGCPRIAWFVVVLSTPERCCGAGAQLAGTHTKPTTTLAVAAIATATATAAADSSRIKRETLEPRERAQPTRIMKLIWAAATVRQSWRGEETGIEIEREPSPCRAMRCCGRIFAGHTAVPATTSMVCCLLLLPLLLLFPLLLLLLWQVANFRYGALPDGDSSNGQSRSNWLPSPTATDDADSNSESESDVFYAWSEAGAQKKGAAAEAGGRETERQGK